MKQILQITVTLLVIAATATAQGIPQELWGKWRVRRDVPTSAISCWGEGDISAIIGTEIEYSAESFRWKDLITKHPSAKVAVVSAEQFHDENSGQGTNSSQVTFCQLGIKTAKATQITITHPAANITAATTEIPGDDILVKDQNTIVLSICSVYFEAKRVSAARP